MHACVHTSCIEEYANCKGLPIAQCCPFKCNVSETQVELMDSDPSQEEPVVARSSSPDPVQVALAAVDAAAREVD